jgi:hypothetical protein
MPRRSSRSGPFVASLAAALLVVTTGSGLAKARFVATLRTQCRQACDETIRQCVTAHGGRHRGACTARVRGQCRRHGLQVCLPPPTTTTIVTSTTSTTTTSTTTISSTTVVGVSPTTTSSTTPRTPLPPRFRPYVGRWVFQPTVIESTCDGEVPPNALRSLVVDITSWFDVNQVLALGKDGPIGFNLIAVFDGDTLVLITLDANPAADRPIEPCIRLVATFHDPITDPEIGTVRQTFCPRVDGSTCETTWTGTWVRPLAE